MKRSLKKSYQMDLSTGPILGKLLRFTLPLMLSSLLQLLFNAADIVVVGRFAGDTALAAVGSNSSLITLITNIFMGLSIGTNVLAARSLGAKDDEQLHSTVHTSVLVSLLSGLLLIFVGLVGARQFLTWMASPPEVIDQATLYLRIYFAGMPAMMFYNFGAALLRAAGDTRRPLYYLTLAGVVNVALNLVFVIVFHMDVAGVALATIISQYVSAALVMRCLLTESGALKLRLKDLHINWRVMGQILRIGLPAGVQGIIFSISNVVIQSSINSFGAIVVAGNSAAANIEGFVYVSMNAFYQACISFVSQNLGAGKIRRIRRIVVICVACVAAVGFAVGTLGWIFGEQLLSIYTTSEEVVEMGMLRLDVICRLDFICGIMDVMVGALRGIGYSLAPMIVSVVGVCGLRLLWLATVFQVPEWHTTTMIYLSYPVSWIITIAAHVTCFVLLYRRLKKKHPEEETK